MDIGTSNYSFVTKVQRRYRRSTPAEKLFLGVVSFLFLYLIWPSGKSKQDTIAPPISYDSAETETVERHEVNYLSLKTPLFNPSSLSLYNYENGGNMMINRKDNKVRLVRDKPHQVGYLFSELPLLASNSQSFEVNVEFSITGSNVRNGLYGDGLAIWLTEQKLEQGDVFGMKDGFKGLGVFVDTYKNGPTGKSQRNANNNAFPYCSIQHSTDGLPKYNKGFDGSNTEIGGCSLKGIYNAEQRAQMRLVYLRHEGYLLVEFDKGDGKWKRCIETKGIELPENMYLGFSAETGELSHNVDLYQASVYELKTGGGDSVKSSELISPDRQEEEEVKEEPKSQSRNRRFQKRRGGPKRKSLRRLERSEKKVRLERDVDNFGFLFTFFRFVWTLIKLTLYLILFAVVAYILWCVYRVQREKAKRKRQGGLL